MSFFEIRGLSKQYERGRHVFVDVNLSIKRGEILAVMGPSGCGKTTLLRCLAGLEDHQSGRVMLDGRDVTGSDPYLRNMALIAQNAGDIFPWLSARETIATAARKRHYLTSAHSVDMNKVVEDHAQLASLPFDVLQQKGRTLSGGQKQRLSLARVLAERPALVLADEPLSNLDEALVDQLIGEMRQFFKWNKMTVLYVTHNAAEAERIADRVVQFSSL